MHDSTFPNPDVTGSSVTGEPSFFPVTIVNRRGRVPAPPRSCIMDRVGRQLCGIALRNHLKRQDQMSTRLYASPAEVCVCWLAGIPSRSSLLPSTFNAACHPLAQPPHQLFHSLQGPVNAQAPADSPLRTRNSTRFIPVFLHNRHRRWYICSSQGLWRL